jgi:hypothetical protein
MTEPHKVDDEKGGLNGYSGCRKYRKRLGKKIKRPESGCYSPIPALV